MLSIVAASALPFKRLDPRTPYSVRQVLSLANKYDMDVLRNRIIEHVQQDWPPSLWQWDKLESEINSMKNIWHIEQGDDQCSYVDDHLPEPASAIRLARDCNVPAVLPAAFYHLSRLSIYDNRVEARHLLDPNSICCEGLGNGRRTAEWNLLDTEDFICLLKGQARLSVAAAEMLHFKDCSQEEHWSDNCSLAQRQKLFQDIRNACRYSRDILRTSREFMERGTFGSQICYLCNSRIRDELASFRLLLWMKLGDLFCLE